MNTTIDRVKRALIDSAAPYGGWKEIGMPLFLFLMFALLPFWALLFGFPN